ncbi:hypothetical protein [Flavobacterium suzhouense]|uniref:YxeA family protein n=1 Tax=Flavobacterium suzhouense TaxID=1529638 RepID=A0ABW5NTB1_9FLAO
MKNKVLAIIFFSIIGVILYSITKSYIKKNDVENHGKISIGKYVYHESWAKGELNIFEFYIGKERYKGNGGRAGKSFSKNIGKFYKIIYSQKYPGVVRALFDEEVTDTMAIFKAGFSKDDIKILPKN